MKCETCKEKHSGDFGSGRFCSVKCSKKPGGSKTSSKFAEYRANKICKHADCGANVNRAGLECSRCKNLRQRYGLTKTELEIILVKQKNKCAICSCHIVYGQNIVNKGRAVIDHCHSTGAVRDILCNACNTVLGHIENNNLDSAIFSQYLKSHTKDNLNLLGSNSVVE